MGKRLRTEIRDGFILRAFLEIRSRYFLATDRTRRAMV